MSIGTDAHAAAELGFMRWAVEQPRRGWARAPTEPLGLLHGRR